MNILLKTKKLYDEIGIDMYRDISAYSINGYVFITPETFMVGKGAVSYTHLTLPTKA